MKRRDAGKDWLLVGLITLLGLALRLYHLGSQSLWYDEAYSWLYIAATDFWTGIKLVLVDLVQLPLYYILGRPFTLLGDNAWALRLPSAMAGTLALPAIFLLGKQVGGRRVGLLAATLLALNPFHIWFSRDARNYALTMLFVVLAVYSFVRLLSGHRMWIWFTLFSGLGFVTHYFCLLIPLAQFGYFLLNFRRRHPIFRRWVLSLAIAFLPALAWSIARFTLEERSMGIAWIPAPKPWAPLVTLWNFSLVTIGQWTLLATTALPAFALALAFGLGRSRYRQWLILWLTVPLTSVALIAWVLGRKFYVDRYFIITLPAYLLLLVLGVRQLPHRWAKIVLSAALLAASVCGTARLFTDPHLAKQDWRTAMTIVTDSRQPGDLVVLRSAEDIVPASYYERDLAPWTYLHPRPETNPWLSILAEFDSRRVWLIYVNPIGSNHLVTKGIPFDIHTTADEATRTWLADHRDHIVAEHALPGISVVLIALSP